MILNQNRFVGTAVPLFSLRTRRSYGAGDITDLKIFSDWIAATGQKIIQLLPINDTTKDGTWRDSYPYNCISVFALHPIYIDPDEIGRINNKILAEEFQKERTSLNSLDKVDYERVMSLKLRMLRELFREYANETFSLPEFLSFYDENSSWLPVYAAFCTLRDRFSSADFSKWGDLSSYNSQIVDNLHKADNLGREEMDFYIFVQFHLHRQFRRVKKYCSERGIYLKGDLPIGISPHSAEAWSEPELFNTSMQAGAPPDAFSSDGQNWGFPTYNWDTIAGADYSWWKRRLSVMSYYFDIYRIDHILGFFRIWEIPKPHKNGALGHFNPSMPLTPDEIESYEFHFSYDQIDTEGISTDVLFIRDLRQKGRFHPRIEAQSTSCYMSLSQEQKEAYNRLYNDFFYKRHNDLWAEHALKILPHIISSSTMIPCGEDLGMIPESVPRVIEQLNIASLEIQRMPKSTGIRFADPAQYHYLSVCSTGTHDMSNLREWWEEDRAASELFFMDIIKEHGDFPAACEPWVCKKIIRQHIESPSVFAIFPLQEWLSMSVKYRITEPHSERINIPANPEQYWQYRMPVEIEKLIEDRLYNDEILLMIQNSGR